MNVVCQRDVNTGLIDLNIDVDSSVLGNNPIVIVKS